MNVSLIAAATVCGRIGPGFKGSAVDREFLIKMRGRTGAGILGAGTLRFQDVSMESGSADRFRCIISSSGMIPIDERPLFFSKPSVIFTGKNGAERLYASLPENVTLVRISELENGVLSLQDAVNWLADRGVNAMLVEGGGMLNYEAIRQRVARELLLTVCPQVSGLKGGQSLFDGPGDLRSLCAGLDLQDLRYSPISQEIFLRYRFIYSVTPDVQKGSYA